MAAPTQEYPAWLTPVPTTFFDQNGFPFTTSTTVLRLPLTYYGPSIPLGPDWVYGGLTSPASTETLPTLTTATTPTIPPTATTMITTTAIPSTSTTDTSSLSTSSSFTSTSFTSTTSSISNTPPTTSRTPTTIPNPPSGGGLTRGQLVGVIVASILGFIFLLVLILAIYLFCKGRKRRRSRTPLNEDYMVIPPGGRYPGEGSPRHSGEEQDPFLQPPSGPGGYYSDKPQRYGNGSGSAFTEMGARSPLPPPTTGKRVPPPPIPNTSLTSSNSNSTSSNSGYGEPLTVPTLGIKPIREEPLHEREMSGNRLLTPEEMRMANRETVLPPEPGSGSGSRNSNGDPLAYADEIDPETGERYTGAYAYNVGVESEPSMIPPKLVDPVAASKRMTPDFNASLPRPPFGKRQSGTSFRSSGLPPDAEEKVTLLTARRVKVEDLGPRTASSNANTSGEEGGKRNSNGSGTGLWGGIVRRMSWFNKPPESRKGTAGTSQPLLLSTPLSDKDLEFGRTVPPTPMTAGMSESLTSMRRALGIGMGSDGVRPVSGVSARSGYSSGRSIGSGGTIYHDALSSLPSTPLLTPLPRAITPVVPVQNVPPSSWQPRTRSEPQLRSHLREQQEPEQQEQQREREVDLGIIGPPPYEEGTASPANTSYSQTRTLVPSFDILDLPAPSRIFNSSNLNSNSNSNASLKPSISNTLTPTPSALTPRNGRSYGLPPGLNLTLSPIPTPKAWKDAMATPPGVTCSDSSGGGSNPDREPRGLDLGLGLELSYDDHVVQDNNHHGITIDVLEEEPPVAGDTWRSMAQTVASGSGTGTGGNIGSGGVGSGSGSNGIGLNKRATFGTPLFIHNHTGNELKSEQGSLHSMRSSHLGSLSQLSSPPRSTGSASVSNCRRDGSLGSSTTGSSASAYGLIRHGSVSSDGRWNGRSHSRRLTGGQHPHGHVSPALSAFGSLMKTNRGGLGIDTDNASVVGGIVRGDSGGSGDVSSGVDADVSGTIDSETMDLSSPLALLPSESESAQVQATTVLPLTPARRAAGIERLAPLSPTLSPLSMPWAGGLDDEWDATSS